ncbi:unnamed protein product [Mytilus coruscus]|uniref:Uncharacterized protein n=1 Tax=Mytilus coruscus TaxID=42192 RepID=A0A6J8C672_MYTCO|nr:unnamed protein product [Mytilus coruscus]
MVSYGYISYVIVWGGHGVLWIHILCDSVRRAWCPMDTYPMSLAAVKRCENAHKDHLSAIQKDVIRVLRAIMHFRDHMCTLMEKENLKDLVYSLQNLKNLIPDQLAPDPKELLAMLVANVVEYMHNMELIISNAFLAMRMMIKGTMQHQYEHSKMSERQTEIRVKVKDAETRMKTMDTTKIETIHIARRLQVAKERLEKFEQMTITDEQAKVIIKL